MPISAVDSISLAFHHTKRQLAQPFRSRPVGEVGIRRIACRGTRVSTGFNFPTSFKGPHHPSAGGFPENRSRNPGSARCRHRGHGLGSFVVFTYISSVMRFILFDSVTWSKVPHPGWMGSPARCRLEIFLVEVGLHIPCIRLNGHSRGHTALFAFANGWFKSPREHLAALVLTGIIVFSLVSVCGIVIAVVHVFTKDFVVPQMALEGVGAVEGWRRLWPKIQQEKK